MVSNRGDSIKNYRTTIKLGNKIGKKNNFVDISGDKLAKLHTRMFGYGYKNETITENQQFFKNKHKATS